MEFSWSVSWVEMHTDERFLRTLAEGRWGLEESEGDLSVMAETEAQEPEAVAGSDYLLPPDEDTEALSVGEAGLLRDMGELEALLREFGGKLNDQRPVEYRAQKALYRCVDVLKGFNNGCI